MAVMNPETGFETYPLEKFIALIDEESDLNTAITKLHEEGFGNEDVQYFHGEKGLDILDLCADHHGLIAKIMRVITFTLSREAEEGITMTKETLDKGGYFDLTPLDLASDFRKMTVEALEALGIQVETSHHEVGPSQHEIDLRYTDALTMADNAMTYRLVVKEVALRNNVYATFMPKPLFGENDNQSGKMINSCAFT